MFLLLRTQARHCSRPIDSTRQELYRRTAKENARSNARAASRCSSKYRHRFFRKITETTITLGIPLLKMLRRRSSAKRARGVLHPKLGDEILRGQFTRRAAAAHRFLYRGASGSASCREKSLRRRFTRGLSTRSTRD